mgnify:CR=1 FL=1
MTTILLLLISIPLIEIYLFIKIGSYIGAFNTVSLILITAIVGIIYARYEGFNTLRSGMSQLIKNEIPIYEIISGAALAFAALLLILPGFATDLMGLILIFPPETLLTLSCKRTPKVPICANEPGKVLAIFHLIFLSDVVPSELCSD